MNMKTLLRLKTYYVHYLTIFYWPFRKENLKEKTAVCPLCYREVFKNVTCCVTEGEEKNISQWVWSLDKYQPLNGDEDLFIRHFWWEAGSDKWINPQIQFLKKSSL